ncbi:MAG: GyrI-like domain-containing protein [Bacteroidota bacterium]|nr:GyrI-like domain-containing protein [Bacteroidota bacterium]
MKALKIIGTILLVLIGLFLIIAAFLPRETGVEESISIKAPANTVFKQVNTMANWEYWSPFKDPAMELFYTGEASGVGAMQEWNMKGDSGTLTIVESAPYTSIKTKVELTQDSKVNGYWVFDEKDGVTDVTWGLRFQELSYPFGRYIGLIFNMMMGESIDKGLKQLKDYAESLPPYPVVSITNIDETKSIVMTDTVYMHEMAEKMDFFFSKMTKFAKAKKLEQTAYPFCIYLDWNPDEGYMVTKCGFPVNKEVKSGKEVEFYVMPPTKAVMSVYKGPYDKMEPTYNAINEYIAEFGLEMNGAPIEMYVTDPKMEPDTSKWTTQIYFPVK